MNNKLVMRKAHRYIGLLISLQLLAWTLGGIWFSWNSIDDIHGDHLKKSNPHTTSHDYHNLVSANQILKLLPHSSIVLDMQLIKILDTPIYKIKYKSDKKTVSNILFNASTGIPVSQISKQQAIEIAKSFANFQAEIKSAELITHTDMHHEYREKPLPAWAIAFDYEQSPIFYVSQTTGELISVRHDAWRIFDFLWMLHTMDYKSRDDFNNWLLKFFSLLALFTSITGIIVFIQSSRKIRKLRQNK